MFQSPPALFNQGAPLLKLSVFVSLCLLLIIADYQFRATEQIRATLQIVLYPIQIALSQPGKLIDTASDNLRSLSTMKAVIEQQTIQIQNLSLLSNHAEHLEIENANLRKLLALQQQVAFKTLATEIIYKPSNWASQKIVINRGLADGVNVGMPVASDTGIIGQIIRVFQYSAEVSLIEERDSAIPVLVSRNGVRGALFGMGRAEPLDLRFINSIGDLDVGDYLTTSGIDGTYPAGFPVAIITKIDRSEKAGTFISCRPVANLNRFRHLMVLLYQPSSSAPNPIIPDSVKNKKNAKWGAK